MRIRCFLFGKFSLCFCVCNCCTRSQQWMHFNHSKIVYSRQIDGIAPTFVKKPAIRQEDDGKRLLFECKIKADPKPSVTWSHNAAVVTESKRHKVRNIWTIPYCWTLPEKLKSQSISFTCAKICILFYCSNWLTKKTNYTLLHLKLIMSQLRMLANIKWRQKMNWAKVMQPLAWTLTVSWHV